jgi:glutamate-1-semialdehyde 2,1-aminomutase
MSELKPAALPSLKRSRLLFEQAQQRLAAGVSSTLRLSVRPTPLFVVRGEGALLEDVDGNSYIDYTLAYGPLILGHAPPAVVRAVTEAAAIGSTFGAQHEGEVALSSRICELVPNADQVCFSNSGTEAVMVALRLARAYSGRSRIIRFAGHYHGWSDAILATASAEGRVHPVTGGQSLAALDDLIVLQWNDEEGLGSCFEALGSEIAAVVCEPIVCNAGCLYPRASFLELLRTLPSRHGALLIFDEVITGFRVAPGGAQELLGATADLAIFGKALSAGYPLSAVTGRRHVMELIADGTVLHMGTLNGNTVSTAAALATLQELTGEPGVFNRLCAIAERLSAGIEALADERGVALVVNAAGPVFQTLFTSARPVDTLLTYQRSDTGRCARFAELLLAEGVYVRPSGLWYVSTAHTEEHVEQTLGAVDRVLRRL